jgi:hypothetical protein
MYINIINLYKKYFFYSNNNDSLEDMKKILLFSNFI